VHDYCFNNAKRSDLLKLVHTLQSQVVFSLDNSRDSSNAGSLELAIFGTLMHTQSMTSAKKGQLTYNDIMSMSLMTPGVA
jgi:hypothetical protein